MAPRKKQSKITIEVMDSSISEDALMKMEKGEIVQSPWTKSIIDSLEKSKEKPARLSFEEDPLVQNKFGGLYYAKVALLPDAIIKRVALTDDLVAAILRARGNMARSFGNELQDRFSSGYRIEVTKQKEFDCLSSEDRRRILEKISKVSRLINTCGKTKGLSDQDFMSFSEFLYLQAINAVKFGRFATELIWTRKDIQNETPEFHSFRPTDPATIFRAVPDSDAAASALRKQAISRLQQLRNEKIDPVKFQNDEYAWVQVINGVPVQAFKPEEMLVTNCYPSTDIEFNGYPVTPIDTAIAAIVMHINITNHNKLYFQNGRASKGMLLIQSDDLNLENLQDIKQQFQAAINNTLNSWKMPIIKVGQEDKLEWRPIDNSTRDMEFQYLSDMNCRVILSAFNMSPDELPGYTHLSRATNSQAMSESNNEFKLEAARDVGIRPLIASLQDFLNTRILPLIDEEVAKYCELKLYGLEAETPQQEALRLEKEQTIYATYNDILSTVDKDTIPARMGGDFPLNPIYNQLLDKYLTVGEILEFFFKIPNASKNPELNYRRDPFWFQQVQITEMRKQQEAQQQMAQQQLEQQQAQAEQEQQAQQNKNSDEQEFHSSIDNAMHSLHKSEKNLTPNQKKLAGQHKAIVENVMKEFNKEAEVLAAEIADLVVRNRKE